MGKNNPDPWSLFYGSMMEYFGLVGLVGGVATQDIIGIIPVVAGGFCYTIGRMVNSTVVYNVNKSGLEEKVTLLEEGKKENKE